MSPAIRKRARIRCFPGQQSTGRTPSKGSTKGREIDLSWPSLADSDDASRSKRVHGRAAKPKKGQGERFLPVGEEGDTSCNNNMASECVLYSCTPTMSEPAVL